jgi:hypothetical protein
VHFWVERSRHFDEHVTQCRLRKDLSCTIDTFLSLSFPGLLLFLHRYWYAVDQHFAHTFLELVMSIARSAEIQSDTQNHARFFEALILIQLGNTGTRWLSDD